MDVGRQVEINARSNGRRANPGPPNTPDTPRCQITTDNLHSVIRDLTFAKWWQEVMFNLNTTLRAISLTIVEHWHVEQDVDED